MKVLKRRMITMVLVLSMICGGIGTLPEKQASAKAVSKVTKVITITNKKKGAVWHTLSVKNGEKVKVKVEFLSVKGKVVDKYFQGDNIWLFGFGNTLNPNRDREDCFFHAKNKGSSKLNKNSFKKGNTLTSSYGLGRRDMKYVYWEPLKGITKMKLKVTYFTVSGKEGINSVKTKRKDVYDPGWK